MVFISHVTDALYQFGCTAINSLDTKCRLESQRKICL